jgi:hypothetical protein
MRFATRRLSATVRDGFLSVVIEGASSRRWPLPPIHDGRQVRALSEQAQAWAETYGATYGQLKAIHKALTEAGYYITGPRRPTSRRR